MLYELELVNDVRRVLWLDAIVLYAVLYSGCGGGRALFAGDARVIRCVLEALGRRMLLLELCALRVVGAGSCARCAGDREGHAASLEER